VIQKIYNLEEKLSIHPETLGSRFFNLDENPSGLPVTQKAGQKKQGATGITTAAPYVAGQWGRGDNRLPG
jgi:hypothetical protein